MKVPEVFSGFVPCIRVFRGYVFSSRNTERTEKTRNENTETFKTKLVEKSDELGGVNLYRY